MANATRTPIIRAAAHELSDYQNAGTGYGRTIPSGEFIVVARDARGDEWQHSALLPRDAAETLAAKVREVGSINRAHWTEFRGVTVR